MPFALRDRFGDLYLDALETQTKLQRRLSRLEATLERQVDFARAEVETELIELRSQAEVLMRDNARLRRRLAESSHRQGKAGDNRTGEVKPR